MMLAETEKGSLSISGKALVEVDGEIKIQESEIEISDGIIKSVRQKRGSEPSFSEDSLILPGLIDFHAHCREDASGKHSYKEDFQTAGRAALAGGVCALADMPNNPVPPKDQESLNRKAELAKSSPVDVLLYAAFDPQKRSFDSKVPFKLFLEELTDDQLLSLPSIFEKYKGSFLAVHAEDPQVLRLNLQAKSHEEKRPPEAEIKGIEKVINALRKNPCLHLHLCHVSLKESLQLVREAKELGLPLSCEVTLHHLFFHKDNFPEELSAFRAVNPPLRNPSDCSALREALLDGTIDMIVSDHAPHTPEEKKLGASGFPGLEVFGSCLTLLMKEIPLQKIVEKTAIRPGEFWERFTGEKRGFLKEGYVGSLTILRPSIKGGANLGAAITKCGWSPYFKFIFPGYVEATIVKGRIKFKR